MRGVPSRFLCVFDVLNSKINICGAEDELRDKRVIECDAIVRTFVAGMRVCDVISVRSLCFKG